MLKWLREQILHQMDLYPAQSRYSAAPSYNIETISKLGIDIKEKKISAGDVTLDGVILEPEKPNGKTIVVCWGSGGSFHDALGMGTAPIALTTYDQGVAIDRESMVSRWLRDGYKVRFFDYRGVASSTGKASTARDLIDDAIAVGKSECGDSRETSDLIFYGHSLGAGIAAHAASALGASVICDRGFSRASDVAIARGGMLAKVFSPMIKLLVLLSGWEINTIKAFLKIPEERRICINIKKDENIPIQSSLAKAIPQRDGGENRILSATGSTDLHTSSLSRLEIIEGMPPCVPRAHVAQEIQATSTLSSASLQIPPKGKGASDTSCSQSATSTDAIDAQGNELLKESLQKQGVNGCAIEILVADIMQGISKLGQKNLRFIREICSCIESSESLRAEGGTRALNQASAESLSKIASGIIDGAASKESVRAM